MCPIILYLPLCLSAFSLSLSSVPWVESSRPCPHLCTCYDQSDLVDCRDRGFQHVPRGIPHGAWLLELGGNNLSRISTRAFAGLWSLRVLLLTKCQIQEVEPQVGHSQLSENWTYLPNIGARPLSICCLHRPSSLCPFWRSWTSAGTG